MNRSALQGPLGVSLAAIALVAVVALAQFPAVVSALFSAGATADEMEQSIDSVLARHEQNIELYQKRFTGRSLFFPPPPPPRDPPQIVVDRQPVEDEREPEPVRPPQTEPPYQVVGIFGDQVLLRKTGGAGTVTVRIGETTEDQLTIVRADAPWSVTFGWEGREVERTIFSRPTTDSWFQSPPEANRPTRGVVVEPVEPVPDAPTAVPATMPTAEEDEVVGPPAPAPADSATEPTDDSDDPAASPEDEGLEDEGSESETDENPAAEAEETNEEQAPDDADEGTPARAIETGQQR